MKGPASFSKIFLHRLPIDFRKGINGLSVLIETEADLPLFDDALFLFTNKRKDKVKALYWDRTGFALWQKRLEKERFKWPLKAPSDIVTLSNAQLSWLLDGYDIFRMKPHETLQFDGVT